MHQVLLLLRAGFSRADLQAMPETEARVFLDELEAREQFRNEALRKHAKSLMPTFDLAHW